MGFSSPPSDDLQYHDDDDGDDEEEYGAGKSFRFLIIKMSFHIISQVWLV